MLTLFFVHHGITDWNLEKRCTGQSDVPLNKMGKADAEQIAESLRNVPLSRVYTSDLSRAVETAETITQHHNEPVEVIEDPRLREFDFGDWEGLPYTEINHRCGSEVEDDFVPLFPPDGETLESFRSRLLQALEDIVEKHKDSENVAIVTHGLVIALARVHCAKKSVNALWEYIPQKTGVVAISAEPDAFKEETNQ